MNEILVQPQLKHTPHINSTGGLIVPQRLILCEQDHKHN